jgi:3-polyprenyl-4-hydroxybenzoate decarboxylase
MMIDLRNMQPYSDNTYTSVLNQMMEKQEKQIREEKRAREAAKDAAAASSSSSSSPQEITIIPNTSKVTAASSDSLQPLTAQSKPSESLEVENRDRDNVDNRK